MRLLAATVCALTLLALAPAHAETPAFTPRACADATLEGKARCGFVEVPENRERPDGRRIRLNVIVLPALKPDPARAPMYDLEGGPGIAVTHNVGFYLSDGEGYRDRDIVLIDQRGTGGSNSLACPPLAAAEAAYQPLYPADLVARCRAELETHADLSRYGTAEAVADVDAVRQALGHDRLILNGLSYGTTLALRYLATHPDRVRAVVLWSAAPPWAMPPRDHAVNAEQMMRQLFADCAADAGCARAYPTLEADLDAALARLPPTGALAREVFAEKLRTLMYAAPGYRRLPSIIHAAAAGDLAPFRAATGGSGGGIADGVYLSITCTESLAAMDYDAAAAASRATRFGDYRLRRQHEACAGWPKGLVAPGHFEPFESAAPVLLVSGGRDPVTPPEWSADLRRHLSHSAQLVVADAGHVVDGLEHLECVDGIVRAFMAAASPDNLDTACLAQVKAPAFAVAP